MIGRDRQGARVYELTDEEAAFQFESLVLKDMGPLKRGLAWQLHKTKCSHRVVSNIIIHGGYRDVNVRVPRGTVYSTCVICGGTPSDTIVDRLRFLKRPNRVTIHGNPSYPHLTGTVYPTPY